MCDKCLSVRHCMTFCSLHCRKMTFGKVNEMGQFIREAEPEPDVKKSKGVDHQTLSFLPHHFICSHCVLFDLTSLRSGKSLLCGSEYKPDGVAASVLCAAQSPLKYLRMLSSCLRYPLD